MNNKSWSCIDSIYRFNLCWCYTNSSIACCSNFCIRFMITAMTFDLIIYFKLITGLQTALFCLSPQAIMMLIIKIIIFIVSLMSKCID